MAKKERQRLTVDLEALFPGDTVKIGDQVIDIRPLGVMQLAVVARKLKGFGAMLAEDGVTWENYNTPEQLLKIAVLLLEQFPEVLEEASNVAAEDLIQLPIEYIVLVLDKVIEVNLASKETLEENFSRLAGRLNVTQVIQKPKSRKQSKS